MRSCAREWGWLYAGARRISLAYTGSVNFQPFLCLLRLEAVGGEGVKKRLLDIKNKNENGTKRNGLIYHDYLFYSNTI